MATEAAVSDHAAASEEIEKKLKKVVPEKMEILEPEELQSAAAKVEEKEIEPPVAEEVKEIKTDEKSKAEDAAESIAQKVEDKQVKSPPIDYGTKTEGSPITEVGKETLLESETASNSEPVTECKSDEKIAIEAAAETEESKSESVEEKIKKLPKNVEVSPGAEVETIEPKDVKVLEISESIPSVEEKKPLEQSEVSEPTVAEPTVVNLVKDVEIVTGIDKVEDSKSPVEEEAVKEETIVAASSDKVESDTPEIKIQEKDVECSPSDEASQKTVETNEEKIIDKKRETEEKSVVADGLSAKSEGDTEKPAESEVISRDIELIPENEKTEEAAALGETNIAAKVDDKAEKKPKITEAEEKEAEKTPVTETKLEEEKKVDEAVKTDVQDSESTKDSAETKTSQDVPKEDVLVKTQKQSNNIIKMVKHSLGKAKKAIIGKSQNSKSSAASEPKDNVTK